MKKHGKTDKVDLYQAVTDKIVAALEAGTRPWVKGWQATGGLQLRSNGKAYRGVNQFLLAMTAAANGYASPFWLTFKQAQADGLNVRKGEKGSLVVFQKMLILREDKDGNPLPDDKARKVPVLRHYTVFNLSQCDLREGETMRPRFVRAAPVAAPEGERLTEAEASLLALAKPDLRHGGDRAYYSPSGDYVQMPPFSAFKTAGGYVATLAHELVHWTGHSSRLDRLKLYGGFGSPDYAREELVAELGAAMAGARLGIVGEHIENHAAYVASWLKALKGDKRAIFQAATKAQAACDLLLGAEAEEEEEAATPMPLAA